MLTVFRIAAALELLLVCAEKALPFLTGYLPLGQDHAAQIGIVLAVALVGAEVYDAIITILRSHK